MSTAFTSTFHFILQTDPLNNQSMSTKKQNSSFCKLYSIYEEIPEQFLDKTDVDSYFYHNILDISQSHHRIVRVSEGSNKKSFAFKVFHFCDWKLQQRFILKEEVSISEKYWISTQQFGWISQSFWSSQQSIAKYYPNLNLRLDSQKQKTNCSLIVTRI